MTCSYIFVNGIKKDTKCGKPCIGDRCRSHKITNINKQKEYRESHKVSKKKTCMHKFLIGPKKDQICGKPCIGDKCRDHKIINLEKKKKNKLYGGSKGYKKYQQNKKIIDIKLRKEKYGTFKPSPTDMNLKELNGVCLYLILKGKRKGEYCLQGTNKGDRCKLHNEKYLEKKKLHNNNIYNKRNEKLFNTVKNDIKDGKKIDINEFKDRRNFLFDKYKELSRIANGINIHLGLTTEEILTYKYFEGYNKIWYTATKTRIKKFNPDITEEKINEKMKEEIDLFIEDPEDDDFILVLPFIKYEQPKNDKDNIKTKILLQKYNNKRDRIFKEYENVIKIINLIKNTKKLS